ncbi:MAG: HEPN domain-containing protein [Deltaproteobacteria bacterium]|nr:HEPN domain-containing protein [Deltaproteobacteria bacterium]
MAEDRKTSYWFELSEYDLETAQAMLQAKRYLYVGFMCHQAIEKILKGYYQEKNGQLPPKTHNLRLLAQSSKIDDYFEEEQRQCLRILEPLYIETRYPEFKDRIFKELTNERCSDILQKTGELHKWIKQKLST